jgi:hypothetical protein
MLAALEHIACAFDSPGGEGSKSHLVGWEGGLDPPQCQMGGWVGGLDPPECQMGGWGGFLTPQDPRRTPHRTLGRKAKSAAEGGVQTPQ